MWKYSINKSWRPIVNITDRNVKRKLIAEGRYSTVCALQLENGNLKKLVAKDNIIGYRPKPTMISFRYIRAHNAQEHLQHIVVLIVTQRTPRWGGVAGSHGVLLIIHNIPKSKMPKGKTWTQKRQTRNGNSQAR